LELAMMILDLPQARLAFAHLRPWRRALDAIEPSDARPAGVAYSLGDAVTYRAVTDAADVDAAGRFAAHHRYHQVCAVRAGRVVVESGPPGGKPGAPALDAQDDTPRQTRRAARTPDLLRHAEQNDTLTIDDKAGVSDTLLLTLNRRRGSGGHHAKRPSGSRGLPSW
jgi:hypothetical protein